MAEPGLSIFGKLGTPFTTVPSKQGWKGAEGAAKAVVEKICKDKKGVTDVKLDKLADYLKDLNGTDNPDDAWPSWLEFAVGHTTQDIVNYDPVAVAEACVQGSAEDQIITENIDLGAVKQGESDKKLDLAKPVAVKAEKKNIEISPKGCSGVQVVDFEVKDGKLSSMIVTADKNAPKGKVELEIKEEDAKGAVVKVHYGAQITVEQKTATGGKKKVGPGEEVKGGTGGFVNVGKVCAGRVKETLVEDCNKVCGEEVKNVAKSEKAQVLAKCIASNYK